MSASERTAGAAIKQTGRLQKRPEGSGGRISHRCCFRRAAVKVVAAEEAAVEVAAERWQGRVVRRRSHDSVNRGRDTDSPRDWVEDSRAVSAVVVAAVPTPVAIHTHTEYLPEFLCERRVAIACEVKITIEVEK